MKKIYVLLSLFLLVCSSSLQAQMAQGDIRFVRKALMGNMYELALGKVALQKAVFADVKNFSQNIVNDHTRLNDELVNIARKNNVTVPAALDKEHQDKLDKISGYSGADFDKKYVQQTIKDHEEEIDRYKKAVKDAKDPELEEYVKNGLPTLQQHQKMAKDLKEKF
jgi:putative membrane protein